MSTTIITALVFCVIIFAAGLSFRIIFSILAVLVPSAAIFLSIVIQPEQTLIKDYQRNRIMAWLRPSEFTENAAQQQNSIIAIGSGQLYGKGLNNNAVYSVKNGNFISEPQTDFIFAVAGEELGFIGCVAIVLLEILIAVLCVRIGLRAKQKAGSLICCGMGTLILFQSCLNVGVTTGLLPNTGITLPFVSYGVTSLISFCMGIGICLNIGLQPGRYPA
jgi:rod shape determining protein RodA